MVLKLLFSLLFLLCFGNCFSQNPYAFTIDKTNGLPSNSVFDVFQDKKGFMWFATGKGLCRYDGVIIKSFVNENQTSKSGSCIQEDRYGRIWYENFDGYLYYVENGSLHTFDAAESCGYFKYGILDNSLFKLQQNSVQIFDLKTLKLAKEVKKVFTDIEFTFQTEKAFYILAENLHEFTAKGFSKTIQLPPNYKALFKTPIVHQYKDGFILFSKYTNNYLIFENGNFSAHSIDYPVGFIQNCAVFGTEIWICTPKGVLKINPKNSNVQHYFKEQSISYIYKDRQENYWVSTLSDGVHFIDDFSTQLFPLPTTPFSVTHNNQSILIGTEKDEIYTFDVDKKQTSLLYKGNSNHPIGPLFSDSTSNTIYFSSSKFNILQANNLIYEKALALKDIIYLDEKYLAFAATNNSGLLETQPQMKSIWDGILQKNSVKGSSQFEIKISTLNANGKSVAYNSYNKLLFFATNRGLFAQSSTRRTEILHRGKSIYALKLKSYKNLTFALLSNEKVMVIDTENRLTPLLLPEEYNNLKFENIKIFGSSLYLFTSEGIIENNLEQNTFSTVLSLTKEMSVSDMTVYQNQLFFTTSKGLLIKNTQQNHITFKPKLIVNSVLINDKVVDLVTQNVFDYKHNNLKIDFSILSSIPNQKQALLYKINNSKWHKLDYNNRVLNLFSLSPDDYKISLKVAEKNKDQAVVLSFRITKPFWQTNTFLLLLFLLGLACIYYLYHIKLIEINRKNQLVLDKVNLEKNLNQSKLKALKSQMNPHFFYNALNTLQSYILANDKKEAVSYLSKFSSLTRTILEMTEKDVVTLSDEIKTLGLYLDIEKSRFDGDFKFECNIDPKLDVENIKIPSMLLQPYVENAVKHGLLHKEGQKILKLVFEQRGEFLEVSIEDNGIGRKKSGELNAIKNKKHQSFATQAIQNRIDLLNDSTSEKITICYEDLLTPNNQIAGTKVFFKIPLTY